MCTNAASSQNLCAQLAGKRAGQDFPTTVPAAPNVDQSPRGPFAQYAARTSTCQRLGAIRINKNKVNREVSIVAAFDRKVSRGYTFLHTPSPIRRLRRLLGPI